MGLLGSITSNHIFDWNFSVLTQNLKLKEID